MVGGTLTNPPLGFFFGDALGEWEAVVLWLVEFPAIVPAPVLGGVTGVPGAAGGGAGAPPAAPPAGGVAAPPAAVEMIVAETSCPHHGPRTKARQTVGRGNAGKARETT